MAVCIRRYLIIPDARTLQRLLTSGDLTDEGMILLPLQLCDRYPVPTMTTPC